MIGEARTGQLRFWLFAILYCIAWGTLCAVFQSNYRADVIEQYFLGDQWVISSGKNPVLSACLLKIIRLATFESPVAPYIAAELCVLAMLWCVWQLARDFLADERLAFLATLAAANWRYLNIGNLVFANNIFMTLFWTLATLSFYRALTRNRYRDWIVTGIAIGLGLQGKYTLAILVVSILLFMVFNRHARGFWRKPGPYLTLIAALLVFLPHLVWLFQNDFHTFGYAGSRATSAVAVHWTDHLLAPWKFPLRLLVVLLPAFLTLLPIIDFRRQVKTSQATVSRQFQRVFLTSMIVLPILFHMLIWAVTGKKQPTNYAMPMGMYVSVLVMIGVRLRTDSAAFRRSCVLGLAIALVTMMTWAGTLTYSARYAAEPFTTAFPGRRLAEEVERIWTERYGNRPCPFVTEPFDYWYCGNVHVYGKMHMPVHISFVTLRSTNEEVNRRGGIVLWPTEEDQDRYGVSFKVIRKKFPRAERLPDLLIPYDRADVPPVRIGIAIIPLPDDPS